ncbi:hypothetical protein AK973_1659 [Pseudomonas brassicacearum]|nr:hypothetical protein AK973_1659 [Pseudomonas brassicacearum]
MRWACGCQPSQVGGFGYGKFVSIGYQILLGMSPERLFDFL